MAPQTAPTSLRTGAVVAGLLVALFLQQVLSMGLLTASFDVELTADQRDVVVTPALSSSIPLAAALFGPIGVGAGAVYYIGEKMFKAIPEQVNKFLTRKYSIKGSWENPVVERI